MYISDIGSMTNKEIEQLHKKYSHGKYKDEWFDIVWTHSNIVLKIAQKIVSSLKKKEIFVNEEILHDGVLLHDIGVYCCYDEDLNNDSDAPAYIRHGILGYGILKKEGICESVARFAMCHTGVGLTVLDIENGNLPLPKVDMIPISLEEEILCYADKFHTKYPSFLGFDEQRKQLGKYSDINPIIIDRFKMKFGIPDIEDLIEEYEVWHRKVDRFLSEIG